MATALEGKSKAERIAEIDGELVIVRERKIAIEARLLELSGA